MALNRLSLRLRIFLFFAVLMLAAPLSTGLAIWLAYIDNSAELSRVLATYTGLATVFMLMLTIIVWQLFDKYVASALQTLARQMQTAIHSDTDQLQDNELFQYLGPVRDAATDILREHKQLKQQVLQPQVSNVDAILEAQQLAGILRDMDVGVMVMNLEHRILLYNQRSSDIVRQPDCFGLARSADMLFTDNALARQIDSKLLQEQGQNDKRATVKLQLESTGQTLYAKACLVHDDSARPTGYVLVFDTPTTDIPRSPTVGDSKTAESRPHFYDFDLFNRLPASTMQNMTLSSADFVVFDTETTGLKPSAGDEIISIAAVRLVNGRILAGEHFNELVNPGRTVPARSTEFHGITDQMLVGRPTINEVLPRFERFVGDSILVAHNAAFDMKFIELKKTQSNITLENPVLDTVLLSAWLHDHTHKHTLDALAERYGLSIENRHSAAGDAMATARIFCLMIKQLSSRGIDTLADALEISDKMAHIKKHQKTY